MARELDATHIIATLERLQRRIDERFPGSGLGQLAGDLLILARSASAASVALRRPYWAIRLGVAGIVVLAAALLVTAARVLRVPGGLDNLAMVLQTVESGINDAVFLALAILFLLSVEQRLKRRQALGYIHQLRSIAHIIDMHQLTKDPDRAFHVRSNTESSPRRSLSPEALGRYLDYCSELLSLNSKVAALFGERRSDPVVLAAVNEVELLATGLSTKIWQKITILNNAPQAGVAAPSAASPADRSAAPPLTRRSSSKR